MKNFIFYFYNMNPEKIKKVAAGYLIYFENQEFLLKETDRSIEELYELLDLSKTFSFLHKIVTNRYGNLISLIDNKNYVLMKVSIQDNRKIKVTDIYKMSKFAINKKYRYIICEDWRTFLINEVEYLENKYNDIENNLCEYLDYNIGLVENSIQIFSTISNIKLGLSHINLNMNMRLIEFYDPTNIILDAMARDISEYYRNMLDSKFNEVENIDFAYLDENEKKMFFARFMFNKKYFDAAKHMDDKIAEEALKNFDKYEQTIINLYNELKSWLPEIEWLKKTS